MIETISKNLNSGITLIHSLSDEQYCDVSIAPYHSSVGSHIRHILDIFDCIFCGLEAGHVNLADRTRDIKVETNRQAGLAYLQDTLTKLQALKTADLEQLIDVSDDLGDGLVTNKYTLAAAIIQAHSHAIHHFAAMGYVLCRLGITPPSAKFGVNPTTPDKCQVL
ncbi:MAG: hypothetical protein L3J04_10655 [Robiginitomaculum sp.]|nr:hypothetical protein [Robiginitomaculum sp.]